MSPSDQAIDPAAPEAQYSVLIVEDRVHTAQHLRSAVNACDQLQVCGVAYDLENAWVLFETHKPQFVLVDLGLPDGSGVEMVRAAAQADWHCDSMVISVFGDRQRSLDAIRAGAKGYLLKGGPVEDVGRQIMSVIQGGSPMSPKIARYLLNVLGPEDTSAKHSDAEKLTDREQEVLNLVARGYKRREIAEILNISIGTVGIHINNTYRKLEVGSNIEAIARASKIGLI